MVCLEIKDISESYVLFSKNEQKIKKLNKNIKTGNGSENSGRLRE